MKRYPLIALVLLLAHGALSQSNWARRVGGWSNDAYNALATDANGNIYVAGEFGASIQVGAAVLTSQGSLDIIVAKYSAFGAPLWVRRFGGPGLDRASTLAVGPGGELVVAGQFMGTMDLDGSMLTAQGGTMDVFLARLDPSTGDVLWARQGGGAYGVDAANDVSVGPDGRVALTGEFRGTATFDAGTITSVTDPNTGLPSVDVFVASYDALGNALWLKHGAAEYADRGMAVAHDPLGNVYVTGQFSDTITFDQTHLNAMFSAVFIVKFSASGQETWFRRFGGGTYNQVFDLLVVDGTHLLLTGDLQGTVIFIDDQPDLFTAVAPRSSFLVEVDLDGTFIRQTTWGSDNILNTRSVSVSPDEIAVLGRFKCQFTGFSALYGEGTWLATGEHDLYVARFERSDLSLKEAQQFGGQGNKVPGGITYSTGGAPLFCGSFHHLLVFPGDPWAFDTWPIPNGVVMASAPGGFCDDPDYDRYTGLYGSALMDGFIARGWVDGREPYDVFSRTSGPCDRPLLEPFIRMGAAGALGPDTLRACLHADLLAYTHTAFTADTSIRHNAPDFTFQWSSGQDSAGIHVHNSGWYYVDITWPGGCLVQRDSLYVIIDPLPGIPVVSDDVVVNTEALDPDDFWVCEPEQPWLWTSFIDPADSVGWYGPQGPVSGDSIQVSSSGTYTVTVTTPWGCTRQNNVHVAIFPNVELPPLDLDYEVYFPQDIDGNDTLQLCENQALVYAADVVILLDGQPIPPPYGIMVLYTCGGVDGWVPFDDGTIGSTDMGYVPGWNTYSIELLLSNAPCGDDTLFFTRTDSIYVEIFPVTYPSVSISGPTQLCPGDTVQLVATCTYCDMVTWNGPDLTGQSGVNAWLDGPGTYFVYAEYTDTNGCVTSAYDQYPVIWNPRPLLDLLPADGIICPDSIAMIFTDMEGTDYQWYGPLGPLNVDNDTISTTQPGLYYLEMIDPFGCPVTSDPALITDYATPYLNVIPDNTLCEPGETSTLQVVTTGQPSLQWQWPLSGNALQQVVDQPGVYTCTVNACNITTVLSVEIFGNTAVAALVEEPPVEPCPDDVVLLQAVPGMALNYWLPGAIVGPQLEVTESGTYTLVAVDMNGCEASTDITITFPEWAEPLNTSDSTVCAGTPVVLAATGGGSITWYADDGLTMPVNTGSAFDLGIPTASTTYFVQQVEGACASDVQAVDVAVLPIPEAPVIFGPDTLCAGIDVILYVEGQDGVTFTWTTPQGVADGDSLLLEAVSLADAGTYTVVAGNTACSSTGPEHGIVVLTPQPLSIGADTLICPGGAAVFTLPTGFANALWNGTAQGSIFTTAQNGEVVLVAADVNGCAVSDTALVAVFAFTVPVTALPVEICYGADALLEAQGSGTFTWYADGGLQQVLGSGPSLTVPAPVNGALYYVVQTEAPCTSQPLAVPLTVSPIPMDVQLQVPDLVCAGSPITLSLVGDGDLSGTWTMPGGTATGAEVVISPVSPSDAGVYTVIPSIGPCLGDTMSTVIAVTIPIAPNLGPDTTFCEGGSYYIEVPEGYTDPLWTNGSTSAGIVITVEGTYGVNATDPQGCPAYAQVELVVVHCPPEIPNVITPNGDGMNDAFLLPPGGYLEAGMTVYDRWGSVVWEGEVLNVGFSGRHYRSGEPLSEAVYYYALHLVRSDGGSKELTGYFHLLR